MQVHSEDNAEFLLDNIPIESKEAVKDQFSCQKPKCDTTLLEEYTLSCQDFSLLNFNQLITGTEFAYGFEQLPPSFSAYESSTRHVIQQCLFLFGRVL